MNFSERAFTDANGKTAGAAAPAFSQSLRRQGSADSDRMGPFITRNAGQSAGEFSGPDASINAPVQFGPAPNLKGI